MRVVGFICGHGAEGAFDQAGERRIQYSPDVMLIMMPCAGRVDVLHILRAFREGADAAFVGCCLEGNCHHVYGNIEARKRVEQAQRILESVGLGARRLEIFHLASNQAWKVPQLTEEMLSRVQELGPNPLGARA